MPEKTEAAASTTAPAAESPSPAPADRPVVTRHSVTLDGRSIPYTVTTGTLVLREETEKRGDKEGESEGHKPRADVFFIAYTRDDAGDLVRRPVTFSFNGGP